MATTFDGYPMAQKGQAAEALTAAFTSSFIGSLAAVMLITFLAPSVATFALRFGPPEFFAVYLLTFCSFVGLGREAKHKTIISLSLGLLLCGIGMDTVSGQLRMTFGTTELLRGINFLVAVVIRPVRRERNPAHDGRAALAARPRRRHQLAHGAESLARVAALLGDAAALIRHRLLARCHAGRRDRGILHGLQSRQAFFPRSQVLRHRPHRRRVCAETAAHASGTAALLPMLALGIPGSGTAAIFRWAG